MDEVTLEDFNRMAKALDDAAVPNEPRYIIANPASPLLQGISLECSKDKELVMITSVRIPTAPFWEWREVEI